MFVRQADGDTWSAASPINFEGRIVAISRAVSRRIPFADNTLADLNDSASLSWDAKSSRRIDCAMSIKLKGVAPPLEFRL
jgi:hypothetical protein